MFALNVELLVLYAILMQVVKAMLFGFVAIAIKNMLESAAFVEEKKIVLELGRSAFLAESQIIALFAANIFKESNQPNK